MNIRKKLLKQYLNWFWLRPESAILLALRGAAYHDTHITIIGTGSGLSYAELGPTHHSLEDISIIGSII